jgi:mRNA-degrading endonuclease RelE of RelBE toxin-antitoxin system
MSASEQVEHQADRLTLDDLEAALHLLSEEERAVGSGSNRANKRDLIALIVNDSVIGLMLYALFTGLIIVWFFPKLGFSLLGIGILAFALLCITVSTFGDFREKVNQLRGALQGTKLAQVAAQKWGSMFPYEGCLTIIVGLIVLGGIGWLIFGLIARREILPSSLVLIALSFLIIVAANSVNSFREFKYFSQVSRLRERFQVELEGTGAEQPTFVLSKQEKNLLSEVETQQVNRNVAKVLEEYSQQRAIYSIAIADGPLAYLGTLTEEERQQLREGVDSLQTEPRPDYAWPIPVGPNGVPNNQFAFKNGRQVLIYLVDDGRERVDVMAISEAPREEVDHAS